MKELLITCSIGLYKITGTNEYLLQIITANETNNYLIPITASQAKEISDYDGVEIADYNQEDEGQKRAERLHP